MRFVIVFLLTVAGVGSSIFYESMAPVMIQFFYYGGQGLWFGPEWFKPIIFLNALAVVLIAVKYRSVKIGSTGWLLILFCSIMAASSSQAIRSSSVAYAYTVAITKMVVTYLIFYNISLQLGTKFAKIFLLANMIGGIYLSKSVLYAFICDPTRRVDSSIAQGGGANYIAMLFAMFLPYLASRTSNERGVRKAMLYTLMLVFVTCIIATGSRAGLLALLLTGLYVMFQMRLNTAKSLAVIVVVFFCVLPFVPDYYFDRMQTVSQYSEDESANNRVLEWKASYEMFLDHPLLGIGPSNFYLISHQYTGVHSNEIFEGERVGLVTHNTYLEILSETGLCGLVLLLGLVVRNIGNHKAAARSNEGDSSIRIGLEGGLIAYGICAIFGSLLLRDVVYWYLAVYNGWTNKISASGEGAAR